MERTQLLVLIFFVAISSVSAQCSFNISSNGTSYTVTPNQECNVDNDTSCLLTSCSNGYSCCYDANCEALDYSQSKWIAVNSSWFQNLQTKNCPTPQQCGSPPLCGIRPININYEAVCYAGKCEKIPNSEGVLSNTSCQIDSDCTLANPEDLCCDNNCNSPSSYVAVNNQAIQQYRMGCNVACPQIACIPTSFASCRRGVCTSSTSFQSDSQSISQSISHSISQWFALTFLLGMLVLYF